MERIQRQKQRKREREREDTGRDRQKRQEVKEKQKEEEKSNEIVKIGFDETEKRSEQVRKQTEVDLRTTEVLLSKRSPIE